MARGRLVLFLCQVFQNAPALEESAWHVEATFPFSALERKQHFALAVKITKPFRMFGVGKMRPYVVVNTVEPFKAFLASGELVALDHGDERLDVHPPEFLVPFELLARMAEAVHEIEDAAVLLVPSVVSLVEGDVNGFLNEVLHFNRKCNVLILKHGITNEKTAFKKCKDVVKVHVALFVFQSCCALAQVF